MALDWDSYQVQLWGAAGNSQSVAIDDDFSTMIPMAVMYAEDRIYRELDPLAARKIATSTPVTGTATYQGPTDWWIGRYLVATKSGSRTLLTHVTEDFINIYWPARATTGNPLYWTEYTFGNLLIAPTLDGTWSLEIGYTYRPEALSSSNTETWISTYAPDLFLAASMVYVSGWMKNFGAQTDNPQMAQSWETQYQRLLMGAMTEEKRRKFQDLLPAGTPPQQTPPPIPVS